MNRNISVKTNSPAQEGYQIILDSIKQNEIFDTFEEAFLSFHNYISTKPLWSLDRLEKGMWIELFNKESGKTIAVKGLFDCMDFAKKLGVLSTDGKVNISEYAAITKTVNKCFAKPQTQEYLEKQ